MLGSCYNLPQDGLAKNAYKSFSLPTINLLQPGVAFI